MIAEEKGFSSGLYPIRSVYGIFTYIWLQFMINVGKYSIHGAFGHVVSYICDLYKIYTYIYIYNYIRLYHKYIQIENTICIYKQHIKRVLQLFL